MLLRIPSLLALAVWASRALTAALHVLEASDVVLLPFGSEAGTPSLLRFARTNTDIRCLLWCAESTLASLSDSLESLAASVPDSSVSSCWNATDASELRDMAIPVG